MKTDYTTKALLLAIALGLWTSVASNWLRPVRVQAQTTLNEALGNPTLNEIATNTKYISIDTASMSVSLQAISRDNALRRR